MSEFISSSTRKTILVVDDEEGIRSYLADQLESDNFEVVTAANGLHAFHIMGIRKHVDLMICDMNMPGMSGIQLIDKLHKAPGILPFPIIILTGDRDKDSIVSAAKLGAVSYILKPFIYEDIYSKIKKIFDNPAPKT